MKFVSKIWDKIEDHLAKYVAGLIIVVFLSLCLLLWKWCFTKHSLELYGLFWLLLLGFFIFLVCYFLCCIYRKTFRVTHESVAEGLTNETDIKNELEEWWTQRKGLTIQVDAEHPGGRIL